MNSHNNLDLYNISLSAESPENLGEEFEWVRQSPNDEANAGTKKTEQANTQDRILSPEAEEEGSQQNLNHSLTASTVKENYYVLNPSSAAPAAEVMIEPEEKLPQPKNVPSPRLISIVIEPIGTPHPSDSPESQLDVKEGPVSVSKVVPMTDPLSPETRESSSGEEKDPQKCCFLSHTTAPFECLMGFSLFKRRITLAFESNEKTHKKESNGPLHSTSFKAI